MHLRDYLARNTTTDDESEWLELAEVDVPSGQLVVADPSLYPDGVVVEVVPGRYRIQVIVARDSGCYIIARLRAYSHGTHDLADVVGEVCVDFACLGIGDNVALAAVSQAISPEEAEPIWQSLETEELFGVVPWSRVPNVSMPFVVSGYGDGRYDVRELVHEHKRVGVEIDFLQGIE